MRDTESSGQWPWGAERWDRVGTGWAGSRAPGEAGAGGGGWGPSGPQRALCFLHETGATRLVQSSVRRSIRGLGRTASAETRAGERGAPESPNREAVRTGTQS